ncbi:MAG: ATP-binding cassette subfamily C protein [Neolewinella sp.]|jgi:ABC-type multidrug transport system fused ATPase/permease subunit
MDQIKKIRAILTAKEKREFLRLTVVILATGLLEVLGVASILPFMQLVADPEIVEKSEVMKAVVDFFGFTRTRQLIISTGAMVIGLVVLTNLFTIYSSWLQYHFNWRLVHQLGKRLLAGYLRRPYAFFLTTPTAELSSYILSEVNSFANGVVIPLIEIVGRTIVSLILFGLLFWVDPYIAMIMFGTLGSAYVIIYLLQRKLLTRLGKERIDANVQRYRSLSEIFDGIKTVKAYNRQGFFFNHFSEASDRFATLQPKYQVMLSAPKNILEILAFGTIIGITIYLFLNRGNFSQIVPTLSLYAVAGYRLLPALQKTFKALGSFRHNMPVLDKLYASVSEASSGDDFPATLPKALPLHEKLQIQDLSFQYESTDTMALKNVKLTIQKGETVAFVGATGSGKTTLIDLMVGLLQPTSGHILADDTALSPENITRWRASIAYVPQEVFLFDDSILNNVLMGAADAGAERVERALDLADIGDFVRQLPDGIHTHIGEKGVRLSGGQRQRLGLARALFSDPAILVLDEATSALDNVTERGIINALNNLPQDITTIVIAHRLSTVQHSDRIYFLEQGEIVGQGDYNDLIDTNPAFAEMAQLA